MFLKSSIVALILPLVLASTTWGGVIYSNLNPDPAHLYDATFAYVAANGVPSNEKLAMPFTVSASSTFTVTQFDLALHEDLGGSFAATLTLSADAAGLPGASLGSWTMNNLPANPHDQPGCCNMATLSLGNTAVSITGGSKYWLVVTPIGTTVGDVWFFNNTGATGTSYKADRFGNWTPNFSTTVAAFDVLGVAAPASVPEPSSALIILGCITLAAFRRIR